MLMIIATPIGNLEDITLRAANYLKNADIIACEDTRSTKKLLRLLNIKAIGKFVSYHDHNGALVRPSLLLELQKGKSVALVSDAGTPLISDPGFKLVEACHENNITVSAIPGPTAPILALTMSGLSTDKFTFNGFLPSTISSSRKAIVNTSTLQSTQIWFTTSSKILFHLTTMLSVYGNRKAAVVREMTKLHEEVKNGTLTDLLSYYEKKGAPRGEIVLLVSGATNETNKDNVSQRDFLLKEALKRLSLRDAVNEVSIITGTNKKQTYQLALKIIDAKSVEK